MAETDAPASQADAPDESPEERRRRYLLRRFWNSALQFWSRKGGERTAWFLTIATIIVVLINLGVQYGINVWNRTFFDALENRNGEAALTQGLIFPPLAIASVALGVTAVYLRMTMQRRWRRWMSGHVIDHWLTNGRYYQLNLVGGDHKNPEYRIADDLRFATDSPVDFAVGLFSAVISALTFIVVLWTIGGSYTLDVGGTSITIPGFLVVAAAIYAVIASGSMVWIGRRFVYVAETKNQAEAEFRYVLTRVRENGESIALLGGEKEERAGMDQSLGQVLRRWRHLCYQHMRTTIVSQGSAHLAPVVPVLLCAPKFLEGSMSLGQVMQAASAFVIVQTAFNWLVDNYPRFADWTASARRVASLLVSLDHLRQSDDAGLNRIEHGETDGPALKLCNVSVTLDDGTMVVNEAEVSIDPGERVLVVGESGTGKSSLVRAIAGLWPWGDGQVLVRKGADMALMPQRPYVPVGSLRRAAAYPKSVDEVDEALVREAMEDVGLGHFVDQMDEEIAWEQTLSGGEKQRLAFARLLIHKPDIIIMDESTSALDPPSQAHLMTLVAERLPKSTVISVGHRPELEQFHERKLVMEARPDGGRLVRDEDLDNDLAQRRKRRRFRNLVRRRRRKAS
jgi:putative ATP-binding cassette transporter